MTVFLFRNIRFDNLEGGLGYFCPKNMFLQILPFYLLSLPRRPQLLQIVSIILYLIYHHQHHIDVYVWYFPKSISKSFFTYDTMAERPSGSFDSLKFCGFWGAMPRPPHLHISYLWLPLISNFAFFTMHRLYVLFRPDHLIIWFGFKKKDTRFLICERINNMALLKENKNKLASKEKSI